MARPKTMLPSKPGKENLLIKQKRTMGEALAGMRGGESREGFLGGGNIVRKPDYYDSETLSGQDLARKKYIQQLLGQIIEPNALSSKSSLAMDRRALVNKLSRSTLGQLQRLLPERIKDMDADSLKEVLGNTDLVTLEEQAEIQGLYQEVSP